MGTVQAYPTDHPTHTPTIFFLFFLFLEGGFLVIGWVDLRLKNKSKMSGNFLVVTTSDIILALKLSLPDYKLFCIELQYFRAVSLFRTFPLLVK